MPEQVEIRFFEREQYHELSRFIDVHWRRGHILAQSKELLDWQHLRDGRYDFLGAWDASQKLLGVLGYIDSERYSLCDDGLVWLAIWKVTESAPSGLGLSLRASLDQRVKHKCLAAVGLNPTTLPMYKAFRFKTGVLRHFVAPNLNIVQPQLYRLRQAALINKTSTANLVTIVNGELKNTVERCFDNRYIPTKNMEYLTRRYLNHPMYEYRIFGVQLEDKITHLLVVRATEGSPGILRVVDVVGSLDDLSAVAGALSKFVQGSEWEYADLMLSCDTAASLVEGGMIEVDYTRDIVPNFFEPFEFKNVPIYWAYKNQSSKIYAIFRGDADQDRPNILKPLR